MTESTRTRAVGIQLDEHIADCGEAEHGLFDLAAVALSLPPLIKNRERGGAGGQVGYAEQDQLHDRHPAEQPDLEGARARKSALAACMGPP